MPPGTRTGVQIRKRRQVLRMTQGDLAARLGVATSTVANWERGKHFPLRYQGPLEEVLGIAIDDAGETAAHGPLDDLLPAQDDWERQVLSDPDLSSEWKRELLTGSRAARAAYRARRPRPAREAG